MLSVDSNSIQTSNISVLIELLKQIKNTENSYDTTILLEEIFSLLPEEIQSKLVSAADISTALEELLQNLNMKMMFSPETSQDENPFMNFENSGENVKSAVKMFENSRDNSNVFQSTTIATTSREKLDSTPNFENSPSSLKRKLSRAETIISHLELNLEELKNQNSVLEKKIVDSIAKEGVLNSKIQKEKMKFRELSHSIEQENISNQSKMLKLKELLEIEISTRQNLKENFSKVQDNLQTEIRELKNDKIQLQEEKNALISEYEEKLQKCNLILEDFKKENMEFKEINYNYNNKIMDLERAKEELEIFCQEVSSNLAFKEKEWEEKLHEFENNSKEEIKRRNIYTLEVNDYKQKLTRQQTDFDLKVEELRQNLKEESDMRNTLNMKMNEMEDQHSLKVMELKNEIQNLEIELRKEQDANNELFIKLSNSSKSSSDSQGLLREEIIQLKEQLEKDKNSYTKLLTRVEQSRLEYDELNNLYKHEIDLKKKFEMKFNNLKLEKDALAISKEELNEKINILSEKLHQEVANRETLTLKLNELEANHFNVVTELKGEISSLELELQKQQDLNNEISIRWNDLLKSRSSSETSLGEEVNHLMEDLQKQQNSNLALLRSLEQSRSEFDLLNDSYHTEKQKNLELLAEKNALMAQFQSESKILALENDRLKANNESLLLNIEIHNRVVAKINQETQTSLVDMIDVGCESDDLIMQIMVGTQTQKNDKVSAGSFPQRHKSLNMKATQANIPISYPTVNTKVQTISVITNDSSSQVQHEFSTLAFSDFSQQVLNIRPHMAPFVDASGLVEDVSEIQNQSFSYLNLTEKESDDKLRVLLESTAEIEIQNAQLKSELSTIQKQVLDMRSKLDQKNQQETEIFNTLTRLKSDISQAEFVASISHEDLEMQLDLIESLKAKVIYLEEEVALERNRITIFQKNPIETFSTGTNTTIEVSHKGTMPIEVFRTIDARPSMSRFYISFTYLIILIGAILALVDSQKIKESFFGILTWIDDLLEDDELILM